MSQSDVLALCSQLSGLSALAITVGLGDQIDAVAPGWGKKVLAGLGILSFASGLVVRILSNPTPQNTVTVFDRNTGSTVEMKTVNAPSQAPAPPPVYHPPSAP